MQQRMAAQELLCFFSCIGSVYIGVEMEQIGTEKGNYWSTGAEQNGQNLEQNSPSYQS